MKVIEEAKLWYKDHSSDKVYNVQLVDMGGTYNVNFQYGRRGSSLTAGSKATGVTEAKARSVYNKLVQEKTGKGYKDAGGSSSSVVMTQSSQKDTGFRPQLLNEVDESYVMHLIADPEWCAQEKYDGRRRGIVRNGDDVVGTNRKGLEVPIPEDYKDLLPKGYYILDGEDLGERTVLFDIAEPEKSFKERYQMLVSQFSSVTGDRFTIAPVAWTPEAKLSLYNLLKEQNAEGIVFKKISSHYIPGRPASGGDQLKFKFVATASCVVLSVNDKRSILVGVHDGEGYIPVGNVTVYPNQDIPEKGAIVEVQYLYYFPGGSLFQPVLLGVRDDIDPTDCTLQKLKVKQGEEAEA